MTKAARTTLDRSRRHVAAAVRALRRDRGWTQAYLAQKLQLSQSRLSEIEQGNGSFTAEQFLVILALFNVPASHFITTGTADPTVALQNTLVRHGAEHLHESTDTLPSEQLEELSTAIVEALVDGSPRVLTALGPVFVRNALKINLVRLQARATELGVEYRLGWVLEHVLTALAELVEKNRGRIAIQLVAAGVRLTTLRVNLRRRRTEHPPAEDILDSTIRSEKTLQQVRENRSDAARDWNIVTSIEQSDFDNALRSGLELT